MRNLFFCLGLALALSASGTEINFDFSGYAAGSTPTNFVSALAGGGPPGVWEIVLDDVPPLLAPLDRYVVEAEQRSRESASTTPGSIWLAGSRLADAAPDRLVADPPRRGVPLGIAGRS